MWNSCTHPMTRYASLKFNLRTPFFLVRDIDIEKHVMSRILLESKSDILLSKAI